jgi:hypothetical protein
LYFDTVFLSVINCWAGVMEGMFLVPFIVVVLSLLTTYFFGFGFSARLWKCLLY